LRGKEVEEAKELKEKKLGTQVEMFERKSRHANAACGALSGSVICRLGSDRRHRLKPVLLGVRRV